MTICQQILLNARIVAHDVIPPTPMRRDPAPGGPYASGEIRWTPVPPLASQAQATKQPALPYYPFLEVAPPIIP